MKQLEKFEALLDAGADANAALWKGGATPLVAIAGARDGHGDALPFAEALLRHGADPNLRWSYPLGACVDTDNAQLARLLLSRGARMFGGALQDALHENDHARAPRAVAALLLATASAAAADAAAGSGAARRRLLAAISSAQSNSEGASAADRASAVAAAASKCRSFPARVAAAAAGVRTLEEAAKAFFEAVESDTEQLSTRSFLAALCAAKATPGFDARYAAPAHPCGPLYIAVREGSVAMTMHALEAGASPPAYEAAMKRGLLELAFNAAYDGGGDHPILLQPARPANQLALFELLLVHGADAGCGFDTDTKYQANVSLLHYLAQSDAHLPLVRALLASPTCDIDARDANGATPLFWASRAPRAAKLLVAKGANIWARNSRGSLAWESSYEEGDNELPSNDEDRARLLKAVGPPDSEPSPSRRRRRSSSDSEGGSPRLSPHLAALRGLFGGAWLHNKLKDCGGDSEGDDSE